MKLERGQAILLLVILSVLGVGAYFVLTRPAPDVPKMTSAYDFRTDPKLLETVRVALSLQVIMTRMAATKDQSDGVPEGSYTLTRVEQIRPGLVEIEYTINMTYRSRTVETRHYKRFRRHEDGTWKLERD